MNWTCRRSPTWSMLVTWLWTSKMGPTPTQLLPVWTETLCKNFTWVRRPNGLVYHSVGAHLQWRGLFPARSLLISMLPMPSLTSLFDCKQYVNLGKVLVTDTPYAPGTETLPLTPAKFGTVRRFYIRTGKDEGVLPAHQDEMIANNPPEKVFCMPNGDHAVFFSAPMELFRILTCIAGL